MTDHLVRSIVIVGSGVEAWLAAAALARALRPLPITIRVVEPPKASPEEGLFESGEGCLPTLRALHRLLGIDERDFMRRTHATFKLGIELRDWAHSRQASFLPFGETGAPVDRVAFHHHWLRIHQEGGAPDAAPPEIGLTDFSLAAVAARLVRFSHPVADARSVLSTLDYAYHVDARLYSQYLRQHAERSGVQRIEGTPVDVRLRGADGFIESLLLDGERRIDGDLFIDATGIQGLLIEQALHTGSESWSHWLPCDRALIASTNRGGDIEPYTTATAHSAGWQWRIPLRRSVGSGYIYCSSFSDDESAARTLRDCLDGPSRVDPDVIRFVNGRRKRLWNRNCIAVGSAACFLEPLAATRIHLVHSAMVRLLALFPYKDRMDLESAEYDRLMGQELEHIRDYLILHYRAGRRDDSPFWRSCGDGKAPASLERKIGLFTRRGRIALYDDELFGESDWVGLFTGLGIRPQDCDSLAETSGRTAVLAKLLRMRTAIRRAAQAMPDHRTYLDRYCAGNSSEGSAPTDGT